MADAVRNVQIVVHAAQILDEQRDLLVVVLAAQVHLVGNDAVACLGGGILRVVGDDLGQVHGVGCAVDDVCAVIGKRRAGLVGHAVYDAEQRVRERHTGQALGIVHRVALIHIAVVAADQICLDHLDGVQGQRVGKVAVRGGDVGLDGVGHGVHAGVGDELLGHRVGQLGVNDGDIGRDLKVGDGVLDALLVIGDDREGRDLGGRTGGGGDGAEVGLAAQRRDAEHLAHILKRDVGVLVLDPHGLGCIDGGAAADCDDPVGLELFHGGSTLHDRLHGRVGLDAFKQLYLHAGLF